MKTPKLGVVIVLIVLIALSTVLIRQRQREKALTAEAAVLRGQTEQAALLKTENQKLAAQLQAAAARYQSDTNDLAELRAKAESMRQTEQDNARLKSEVRRLQAAQEAKAADEFDGHAALHWVTMVLSYAREHQGQFPATLPETIPLLKDQFSPALAAKIAATVDRYELMYHGTLQDLTNPPPEAAIIIRGKQAWQGTEGKWLKEYGMGSGTGAFHYEPDGNFEKFESGRIPKSAGQ